jgi:hypothetical protein
MLGTVKLQAKRNAPTLSWVAEQYRTEKMSKLRHSTQRVSELWIKKQVLPRWGEQPITELQPRPVQLWLESLPLAPKTRGHIREPLHRLWIMPCGAAPSPWEPIPSPSSRCADPQSA